MVGVPSGGFDKRLTEALDGALMADEEILALEEGDQGQAIALTSSRIIILKMGLAASGEAEGNRVICFALDSVTAINLRKGPLGAVIQVCAENAQSSAQGGTPDNVIIFTGPGRVKKAEAFAATIESVTQKPINRIDPRAAKRADEPKTTVVEISSDVAQVKHEAVVETATQPAVVAYKPEPEPEEPEKPCEFVPNPKLPRAIRKRQSGPNRLLVAFGILAALTFVGMAVMAPLHDTKDAAANSTVTYGSVKLLRLQVTSVSSYYKEVSEMIVKADKDASAFRTAVTSGNKANIISASRSGVSDEAWQKINALAAPSGLAEAKVDLTNGILIRKNAIAAAAGAAGSASKAVDVRGTLARFDEAESQIKRGLSAINAERANLDKQVVDLVRLAKNAKNRQ